MIKKYLIIALIFLCSIAFVAALQGPTCGNNKCENLKFDLKVGESNNFIVNGASHNITVINSTKSGEAIVSIDGSDPMQPSREENIFWEDFQQKYGFQLLDRPNWDMKDQNNSKLISYTFGMEEKDFCESDCLGDGVFSLKLKNGWNLIYGYSADFGMCDKNQPNKLCADDVLTRYMYIPPLNKYFMTKPTKESLTQNQMSIIKAIPDYNKYMENRAEWVYVKGNKNLVLRMPEDDPNQINDIKLFKGWNLVTMMPAMVGKKIKDFNGSCDIIKAVGYESQENSWSNLFGISLSRDAVGSGFAVKVAENCQFRIKEDIKKVSDKTSTPSMPSLPSMPK